MTATHTAAKGSWGKNLLGVAIALAIIAGLTSALYARKALTAPSATKVPMPVATQRYRLQDSYTQSLSFLGLVHASDKAQLGFERPGRVQQVAVREGAVVAAGQLLASLDTSALKSERAASSARLTQAKAELELAQLKASRQADLRKTGAVSKEAFDDTRLQAQALAAQVDAVTAQLDSIDIQLAKSQILAPFAGIIAERSLDPGTVIAAGTPVVSLIGRSAQEAHIGISVEQAKTLQTGDNYTLELRGVSIDAQLSAIRPDVDPVTRTTTAVFLLPANSNALDGEAISLQLSETVDLAGAWLPLTALLEGQRGIWNVLAVVAEGDGYITAREVVEVLSVDDDRAYVRGSLADGQWVIATGNHRIAAGTAVTPQEF